MRNFGGIIKNSLITTFEQSDEDNDFDQSPSFQHSKFIEPDKICNFMNANKDKFSLFNLNVDSINRKFPHIVTFLDTISSKKLFFSAITIQEARIDDDSDCKPYEIAGYQLTPQGKVCSEKGGLLTYVHNAYTSTIRKSLYKKSETYEALYVSITGPQLKNSITLGNIYRPPRLNNNLYTIRHFLREIGPTITKLKKENSFTILSGDYNINLLKVGENQGYSEFFDYMCTNGFIPSITLPTRFDVKSCSLLDHIWVNRPSKSSLDTLSEATSAVLLKRIGRADHNPGLLFLNIETKKLHPPKYIYTQKIDEDSIDNFRRDLITAEIESKLDPTLAGDPELNYRKIEAIITSANQNNFPVKKVRFNRHRHKVQPWMTEILLLNIKKKDEIYVQMLKSKPNSVEKLELKSKLKAYDRDIDGWILDAKKAYFSEEFSTHVHDIKKTWDTIKTAINRHRPKSKYPDCFNVNGKSINENRDIANAFNHFFTSIGPDLASNLDSTGKPTYESYLGQKKETNFSFRSYQRRSIKNNWPT